MFDMITASIERTGYAGIMLLMFVENLFPPIPSEVIMPLAGFTAARGELHIALVILFGTAGSLLGAVLWYCIGRWIGSERLRRWTARHGRWLAISPEEVDRARTWFERHGHKAVFLGRMVPAIRTLISVPAGLAVMPWPRLLTYSAAGTAIWSSALAMAGYLLEDRYRDVAAYVDPVSNVVMAGIAAYYLYRVVTFRSRKTR